MRVNLSNRTSHQITVNFLREKKSWSFTLASALYAKEKALPVAQCIYSYLLYNGHDEHWHMIADGRVGAFADRNYPELQFNRYVPCLLRMKQEGIDRITP